MVFRLYYSVHNRQRSSIPRVSQPSSSQSIFERPSTWIFNQQVGTRSQLPVSIPRHNPNSLFKKPLNLGDIPLKKLKPEMFHRGPHFETWKEKIQDFKQNNDLMMEKYFTGRWNDNNYNHYWPTTSK